MNRKIHIPVELPKLKRINVDGARLYETPTGNKYPSVTTVTGLRSKKEIFEWRKAVGEEEANKISQRAARRGTRIHSLCEDYINNKDVQPDMFDRELWHRFKPVLKPINNIHCLESTLFSHKLEVAGTVDCIAEYDGVLSVIDFKTSRRVKELSDIPGYFIQCAMYAVAYAEMTGMQPKQLIVLMAIDDEDPSVFVQKTVDWIQIADKERRYFRHRKGF
jgi:hypothetical protein